MKLFFHMVAARPWLLALLSVSIVIVFVVGLLLAVRLSQKYVDTSSNDNQHVQEPAEKPTASHNEQLIQPLAAQHIGVPAYFDPTTSEGLANWNRFISTVPTGSIAILDVGNLGPGDSKSQEYAEIAAKARASHIKLFGYVETKTHPTPTTNKLRPIADIEADITHNYEWYGVDGIFLDEADDYCADAGQDPALQPGTTPLPFYVDLYNYIKKNHPSGDTVALNPGTDSYECMMQVSDLLVNKEVDAEAYLKWTPQSWVTKLGLDQKRLYPDSRFWNLIYSTSDAQLSDVIHHSQEVHAGIVYATSNTNASDNPDLSNPWATLPIDGYWAKERQLIIH